MMRRHRVNLAEREIVRHDDAVEGHCAFQDFIVPATDQPLLVGRPHVAASGPKPGDHVSGDVLVGKKGKVEGSHAVVFRSQTCSPFSTSAA